MSQPDPPERDPSAAEEPLRQWLAKTSHDWMESQSTLWLPAVPAQPHGPPRRGPAHPGPPTGPPLPRRRPPADPARKQRRADRLLWPSTVGAFLAVCLGLTPSLAGALLAVVTGVGSVAMVTARLARSRRPVRGGMTVLWSALVISSAAVGLGGSTIWTAVSGLAAPGRSSAPTEVMAPALTNNIQGPISR
jgi:hypothetical protein